MTDWSELKEVFWEIVDADPAERARQLEALAARDPSLHSQLEQLLAADTRGESLGNRFAAATAPSNQPNQPLRVGPYEITGVLGAGGMGEVYRAHDSRLHRDIAIKMLPRSLTADRERLFRFEREAQTLASLNHPHIAQLYGVEDSAGNPALVMELVDGPTLDTLIAGRADKRLGLTRVLTIARQIADGLDAAHEKGIVHSDLKPGNIALTPSGDVKILDFGIARTIGDSARPDAGGLDGAGTPAYMSPEQARGAAIDKRTDIWAFGCVLHEMLTGHRPVISVTTSDVDATAAILDVGALPNDIPGPVRSLLRHCLEHDPRRRLRDIGDARHAIDQILQPTGGEANVDASEPVARRSVWTVARFAAVAIVSVGLTMAILRALGGREPVVAVTASVVMPEGLLAPGGDPIARSVDSWFAVSPDGRYLALVATNDSGRSQLWIRELKYNVFRPLPDTDGASYPFWSHDSRHIAFTAAGMLKRIAVSGGTPITIGTGGYRSGTWSRDEVILFAPANRSALHRVGASGGTVTAVTRLDAADGEVQHAYPFFLPDGRHFLYVGTGSKRGALDTRGVYVAALEGSEPPRLLLPGAARAQYANGRVLFLQNGQLMAQAFDDTRLALSGSAAPLIERVSEPTAGATGVTGSFSASNTGVLVYQTGVAAPSRPVWFDQSGTPSETTWPAGDYGDVALSPDDSKLAVSQMDPARSTRDIWIYDSSGHGGQRLTFNPGDEFAPVWSPDERHLLFSLQSEGTVNLFIKDPGRKEDPLLLEADSLRLGRFASDWRNGFILYIGGGRGISLSDIWVVSATAPRNARPLVSSPFIETQPRLAPQGDWFVYASNESGRLEIYVDRFPDGGARKPVSATGGGWPRWARDGSAIYFVSSANQLMAAAVRVTAAGLEIGQARPLFTIRPRPAVRLDAYPYDVSRDGHFVVNTLVAEAPPSEIALVIDWPALVDAQ